jgi:hypothetical protein
MYVGRDDAVVSGATDGRSGGAGQICLNNVALVREVERVHLMALCVSSILSVEDGILAPSSP